MTPIRQRMGRRRRGRVGRTTAPTVYVTPAVARFGFDHGWLCLAPTFLDLQRPVLLVDHRLLPDPSSLGLEPFGSRDPHLPLPTTRIVVQHHPGAMISLWDRHPGDPAAQLLGWHRATPAGDTQPTAGVHAGATSASVVVIIGDTHRIQLCWAAVWDSHIGCARLVDAAQHQALNLGHTRR